MDMPPDPFTDEETLLAANMALLELFVAKAPDGRTTAPDAPQPPPAVPSVTVTPDTIRRALGEVWGLPSSARPMPRFVLYVAVGTGKVWTARVAEAGLATHYLVCESPWLTADAGVVVDRWSP